MFDKWISKSLDNQAFNRQIEMFASGFSKQYNIKSNLENQWAQIAFDLSRLHSLDC